VLSVDAADHIIQDWADLNFAGVTHRHFLE
jgi:hypothetical protein